MSCIFHRSIHNKTQFRPTRILRETTIKVQESTPYQEITIEYVNIDRALRKIDKALSRIDLIYKQQKAEDESVGPLETQSPIKDKEDLLESIVDAELITIAEQIESIALTAPSRQIKQEPTIDHTDELQTYEEEAEGIGQDPLTRSVLMSHILTTLEYVPYLERKAVARSSVLRLYNVLKRITNELRDLDFDKLPKLRQLCEIELNSYLFNAILGALSHLENKELLLMMLADMKERKVLADATTYHHLIVSAMRAGDFNTVNKIMQYLAKIKLQPLQETVDLLKSGEIPE